MSHTKEDIIKYVFGEAAKSNVEKRRVGCIIVDRHGGIVGRGYNSGKVDGIGQDIHAEEAACEDMRVRATIGNATMPLTAYVSHQPCPTCAELMRTYGVETVEVVQQFMKFDGDKPRYDLIPPSSLEALAKVLTFGARKYKPNNWKNCEDLDRYVAATMRHFEAYRSGETLDSDSGMPHLWHAMTNLAFLIELDSDEN